MSEKMWEETGLAYYINQVKESCLYTWKLFARSCSCSVIGPFKVFFVNTGAIILTNFISTGFEWHFVDQNSRSPRQVLDF
jgi:hypothetical protein